jgi:hypothetical protein
MISIFFLMKKVVFGLGGAAVMRFFGISWNSLHMFKKKEGKQMNKRIFVNKNNPDSFLSIKKAPSYDGVRRVCGNSVIIKSGYCCRSYYASSVYRYDKLFINFRYPHANEVFRYSFSLLRLELL